MPRVCLGCLGELAVLPPLLHTEPHLLTTGELALSCPIGPPGLGLCSSCSQGFAISLTSLLVQFLQSLVPPGRSCLVPPWTPPCGEVFVGGTTASPH